MRRTCRQCRWRRTTRRSMGPDVAPNETPPILEEPNKYLVYLLRGSGNLACPVEGFKGWEEIRTVIWVHFVHHHVQYTEVILEEGNQPHLSCLRYDMLLLWASLNGRCLNTVLCSKGAERKLHRLFTEEDRAGTEKKSGITAAHLPIWNCSSTLATPSRPRAITGWRWCPTFGSPGRIGIGSKIYL